MDAEIFADIIEVVRRFVRDEVVPLEDTIEQEDRIPDSLRRRAADLGLFGYALPQAHGGLGLSVAQDARLALELGYTTPAFRSMFGTNNGIAGQMIAQFGTADQAAAFLPSMASGDCVASFALTEAEAGSDPAELRTVARRSGDVYVLSGAKRFITNAPEAGIFVVFARTDPHATGARGISAFVVDASSRGLTVGPPDRKMGQAGAHTAEVHFDDVHVPADHLLGRSEGAGYLAAMRVLARGRVHIAALSVGLAQRALDEAVRHAAHAKQGGEPIGRFQLVQAMLAESEAEVRAGRAVVLNVADGFGRGDDGGTGPSSVKLFCTEMLARVADRAVQVHGGSGYIGGVTVERIYRDARLYRLYEGTSEIQKVIIGRALLKAEVERRCELVPGG